MAPKILVVLTSVGKMANGNETGWYLPELAHPYQVLASSYEIVVASPAGGEAPCDPGSVTFSKDDKVSMDFFDTKKHLWTNTAKLSSFLGRATEFEAIFFPGGHGPMFDLVSDAASQKLILEFEEANKVIAAVCHGPAAFINVKRADGSSFLQGATVSAFTDAEEDMVQATQFMPFSLEQELKKVALKFQDAPNFAPNVAVDRNGKLVTGQNPPSAMGVGEAILKGIEAAA